MKSTKETGYLFISVPSGYEVASVGVLPALHTRFKHPADVAERIDFTLYDAGDQTDYNMLFFGDMHLAGLNNDPR